EGPPKFLGYAYFGLYEVKVTPLHNLPKTMDALTSFGVGNLVLESFHSSQLEEVNDRAMKNAIADAKGKAIKMAQEIGVAVGDVVSLTQVVQPGTEPVKEDGRNPMEKINTNEVKATAAVTVTYSIQ
ncbi:MAG TPA: SIMPL domain-containing protein, partial [Candidatus Kapabacteria bacterium]